ncbi:MAG: right-handed parallel beta-helix repeat-containing protein [Cytophaga sp.]|uniref:right-handed parallel beta-helix repeat-containing protein n=1 Tax=Cytophaga sp. TaxID=29535 RepID=UPI003F8059D8
MKRIFPLLFSMYLLHALSVHAQTITVSTATELQNALNTAVAGNTIVLTDGIYSKSGGFIIPANINGTSSNPIILKGTPAAIITSNSLSSGYGLGLRGNNFWVLDGFTIYNSAKGIVLDSSHHNIIKNLHVNKTGDEGIHLRSYSSYNSVENCFIDSTGTYAAGYGEAIYIGSAVSNWPTYTKGNADTCNYNTVLNNSFGDHVASENIDIKEGTKGGRIAYNTFNGTGLNNQNSADSWIDVKGNYYTIECNTGSNTIADGFQTHILVSGWGDYNIFSNNILAVNTTGYGILITQTSSKGTAYNNVVCTNNTVTGTNNGLTNITTQTCTNTCSIPTDIKNISAEISSIQLYPNPCTEGIRIQLPEQYMDSFYIVTDALGKNILNGQIKTGNDVIRTDALPPGLYVVILNDTSLKFIKQ